MATDDIYVGGFIGDIDCAKGNISDCVAYFREPPAVPEPNLELSFFDEAINIKSVYPKTIGNRIKVKLLCWLLPFKLVKWDAI